MPRSAAACAEHPRGRTARSPSYLSSYHALPRPSVAAPMLDRAAAQVNQASMQHPGGSVQSIASEKPGTEAHSEMGTARGVASRAVVEHASILMRAWRLLATMSHPRSDEQTRGRVSARPRSRLEQAHLRAEGGSSLPTKRRQF